MAIARWAAQEPARAASGPRLGAKLLVAAGVVTLVNNYLPGSEHLNIAILDAVSGLAVVFGVVTWILPWHRWPRQVTLILPVIAFAMLAVANRYGGVSAYSYAVYFVLIFVWIGLSQPPLTSFLLAPVAASAYLWPMFTRPHLPPHGAQSVTVAIPVCVLVGEALARSVRRQQRMQEDLAERVALSERQRRHEQVIIDAVADGLLLLGPDGRVTACNAAAAHLLDRPTEALVGARLPFGSSLPGQPVEHRVAPDRWIETVTAVLPGSRETVVALHDISRQRALQESQELFLATTSHELRTPLTVIMGYVTTLRRRWAAMTDEQRREALDAVAGRAEELRSLIDHLLLAARVRTGHHAIDITPFDLVQAVRRVVPDFVATCSRHVFDVVADDLPLVLGDESTVSPILGQLLENAVKYSPNGGRIGVVVRRVGSSAQLSVADEGVGLPPGAERHIFEPFHQVQHADRREYGGVGLGLHIVRQLVERQGGSVTAAGRYPRGAVFTVRLPLALAEPAAPAEPALLPS